MAAIMEGTRYDSNKYRMATGDVIQNLSQVKPGDLILVENTDGTVYVVNYKNEKQPINYEGFMLYYKANDNDPFANVKTVTQEVGNALPNGTLITKDTPAAIITAPKTTTGKASKYLFWGLVVLGIALVAMKLKSKKSK